MDGDLARVTDIERPCDIDRLLVGSSIGSQREAGEANGECIEFRSCAIDTIEDREADADIASQWIAASVIPERDWTLDSNLAVASAGDSKIC